jgi:Tol biopolymer transport system component
VSLASGTKLGPYEIVAPLGAGGMGEVYRARDTRLDRLVAVKVLAGGLAGDRDFQQRFQNEARAISQLTHPHICTLYDIAQHDGTTFLVMELLDGETLADRLARGTPEHPALALDAALAIGIRIADALGAAHQRGIVHRDLKPGNVMLTKTGSGQTVALHVKLLDFGLAKVTAPVVTSTRSLLLTTPLQALTVQGTILGTMQYMAPEQVEGGAVDARSDIFAFGSVLYEMLTGRKAFEGKTQASVIAAILEREPAPLSALEPRIPPLVDATVVKCLAKNPDARWQSAADLATALRWAVSAPLAVASNSALNGAVARGSRGRMARGVAMVAVAAAIFGAAVWAATRYMTTTARPPEPLLFEVFPPSDAMLSPSPIASAAQLALSPDGRYFAFVGVRRRDVSRIWVRRLDSRQTQALAGTEGASFPFWSPDSRFIGFFANGKLKKVDIAGGVPQPLADAGNGRGGAWSPNGDIVFTASPYSAILRVSASGGPVTEETSLNTREGVLQHYWPQFLPDGRRFLYYQRSSTPDHQGIYAKTLGASDATFVLNTDGMAVHTPGYVLFLRDGMLFAIGFDDSRVQTHGDPVRVADGVGSWGATFGYMAVSASATGALAYGPSVVMTTNLHWRNRTGAIVGTPTTPNVYRSPRLSPDEKSVALAMIGKGQGPDIWLLELTRGALSRVTSAAANDWFPVWASDGGRIFFASTRSGASTLFQKTPGAAGDDEQVTETTISGRYPTDVSGDGRFVAVHQVTSDDGYDIAVVQLSKAATPSPWLASPFSEIQARFSPNSRWMAYASDESGRFEVYVRPFPAAAGQWPISVNGGMQPEWRGDGKELFYISADGKLMAVDVTTDAASFTASVPRALFDVDVPEATAPYPTDYAVSADGQRFLVNTVVDQPERPSLTVILNWAAQLGK